MKAQRRVRSVCVGNDSNRRWRMVVVVKTQAGSSSRRRASIKRSASGAQFVICYKNMRSHDSIRLVGTLLRFVLPIGNRESRMYGMSRECYAFRRSSLILINCDNDKHPRFFDRSDAYPTGGIAHMRTLVTRRAGNAPQVDRIVNHRITSADCNSNPRYAHRLVNS